jgi:heme/copper-type cytochrome/quinol oxidase subunit 2
MDAASDRWARTCVKARVAVAVAAALLPALGCLGPHHHGRYHGFTEEAGPIQVVTTQVGGKNVFIPSTIVVTSGHPVDLSIFNTTDIPHGFRIPALGVEAVLPPQEEHVVSLPALEPNQVLKIVCQLHTAHRTATLVVLPARPGPSPD